MFIFPAQYGWSHHPFDVPCVDVLSVAVSELQWLAERGVSIVDLPEAEYETMGCNVLALAPRCGIGQCRLPGPLRPTVCASVPWCFLAVRGALGRKVITGTQSDLYYRSLCHYLSRDVLMLSGLPETRAALEEAGCKVTVYHGAEISRKGEGGPTCLTRPLARSNPE
jgi:N-dimethylarginine dimethylaminohydrolase